MNFYKVITGLTIKEFPVRGPMHEYYSYNPKDNKYLLEVSQEEGISPDRISYEYKCVPIHKIFYGYAGYKELPENLLIAYTEEVEKLLQIPINTLGEEAQVYRKQAINLEHELTKLQVSLNVAKDWLYRYEHANLWQRIKYVFQRGID